MKKKTKSLWSWGVTVFAAVCGVAAFFTIFAQAVKYRGLLIEESFSGLQIALGYTVNDVAIFEPSAGVILAYLFPLIASCALIIGKGNRIAVFLAAATMLTGGVLALCALSLLHGSFVGSPTLAAGPIASGVLSIVGSLAACASGVIKD